MRIHYYISSSVFLENAIYCLIKLDIFADIVRQEGTININNIQIQYPETPKCLKLWRLKVKNNASLALGISALGQLLY